MASYLSTSSSSSIRSSPGHGPFHLPPTLRRIDLRWRLSRACMRTLASQFHVVSGKGSGSRVSPKKGRLKDVSGGLKMRMRNPEGCKLRGELPREPFSFLFPLSPSSYFRFAALAQSPSRCKSSFITIVFPTPKMIKIKRIPIGGAEWHLLRLPWVDVMKLNLHCNPLVSPDRQDRHLNLVWFGLGLFEKQPAHSIGVCALFGFALKRTPATSQFSQSSIPPS